MDSSDDFYLDGDEMAKETVGDWKVSAMKTAAVWNPLFFDIETVPDDERSKLFDLPPLPPIPDETSGMELPAASALLSGTADSIKSSLNRLGVVSDAWLDELVQHEKDTKARIGVLDSIERARKARSDILAQHADRLKLLSTCPEYCQIAALGYAVGDLQITSLVVGRGDCPSERHVLETFWKLTATYSPLVAFNGLAFDLPVILVRSAIVGVQPTKQLDLRPFGKDVVDPYYSRFGPRGNTDSRRPGKLKSLAKAYGLDVPAGDIDGSQVHDLMHTPEGRATVAKYVASDVEVLRSFYRKLTGYFWV